MKRLLLCLLSLSLLFALLAPMAGADVLWEPNNSFYAKHYKECSYEGRFYAANGPDGYVTLWDAPKGVGAVRQFENGTKLYVYWLYKDWGCVSLWGGGKETSGWVNMSQMLLVYDHISFEEEYGDRFQDYTGEFAGYSGDAETVRFFEYPGAAEVSDHRNLADVLERHDYISHIFVDEDGRSWGYVAYLYGHIDGWFCLDEPDGESFPLREVAQEAPIQASTPHLPLRALLPFILVGGVVVVTLVLLLPMLKKKRA